MKDEKRRVLAFIASALIKRRSVELIDLLHDETVKLRAFHEGDYLEIRDEQMLQFLTACLSGSEITLYDFNSDDFTSMAIDGSAFEGYDFESESFYKGFISNDLLLFNDSEYDTPFEYRILTNRPAKKA